MNSRNVSPGEKGNIPTMMSLGRDDTPKQTTLTQIYNPNLDEESSIEETLRPVNKNKKREGGTRWGVRLYDRVEILMGKFSRWAD